MSITHSLKFESTHTVDEILSNLLSSNIGLRKATYDQMKAEGLFSRVSTVEKLFGKQIQEKYKVATNLNVTFDEDSDGDTEEGIRIVGRTVAFLLSEEKGDAIFFYVIDTPILKRINGLIKVTNEPEFDWLRSALDEANLNYEPNLVDVPEGFYL